MEELIALLRERRIKHGADYAIVCKHGAIRVLCDEVFQYAIEEAAAECNYRITHWYTYTDRG